MILNKNSLVASYTKSGTKHTIYLAPYLTKANMSFPKEWDSSAGRNLAKSIVGTFDIFTKIVCYFKPLTQTELETIMPLLNAQVQTITYYDPEYKRNLTIDTYTGDPAYDCTKIKTADAFNISFISRDRRI